METKPSEPESLPLKLLVAVTAAGLFVLALIPKRGEGEEFAAALGLLEIVLLIVLCLGAALPRIQRANVGCVVQGFLAVAAITAALAGSILLVLFACSAGRG